MTNMTQQFLCDLQSVLNDLAFTDGDGADLSVTDGLSRLRDILVATRENSNKVMLIGNGGSAAIASHAALDLWKNGNVRATAFNDLVQLTALSNDYGFENVFSKSVENFANRGDLLIAISSSGRSDNIVQCSRVARKIGCAVITFSGFTPDNYLRMLGDLNLYVPSDRYGIVESAHQAVLHGLIEDLNEG